MINDGWIDDVSELEFDMLGVGNDDEICSKILDIFANYLNSKSITF